MTAQGFALAALAAALSLLTAAASAATAPRIVRVVLVQRHGVRPPTSPNTALARYSNKPWPAWPVAPGELTPHGGETVALMGATLRADLVGSGILPAQGCPAAGSVKVWADGTDQRTRRSGQVLAAALAPGCALAVGWAAPSPRDPVFGGDPTCPLDEARAASRLAPDPADLVTPEVRLALDRLQAILAPDACAGGKGLCLAGPNSILATAHGPRGVGPMFLAASLSEDILLEYAEGMPLADVGWGKVRSAAGVAALMAPHERFFRLLEADPDLTEQIGAPMAHLILAALAGQPGALSGPGVRLLALAGHDTNIAVEGALFGLAPWTLAGQPDHVSPAETLAFEVIEARGKFFVRPILYYETLDQLRLLRPARARRVALRFADCAEGPLGSCPLERVEREVATRLPAGCLGPALSLDRSVAPTH